MPKRSRDTLTGGSGDVNPQILTISAVQTGADVSTIVQQPLPIPRYPTSPGKNLVMEFLWIDYYHVNPSAPAGVTATNLITVTTNPTAFATSLPALQDARLLDAWYKQVVSAAAPADRSFFPAENSQDLYDGAGHGLLVATDNLYIGVYSIASAVANQYVIKIAYRWKIVTLEEYIGIVQSQQG